MLLVVGIICCCGLVIIWVFACTVYYVPQGTFSLLMHPFSSVLSTMRSTNTSRQHCHSSDFPNIPPLGNKTVLAAGAAAVVWVRRPGPPCSLLTRCHAVFSYSDAPKPFILLWHLSLSVVLKVLKWEVYTYVFACIYLLVICICINGLESWSGDVFYIFN